MPDLDRAVLVCFTPDQAHALLHCVECLPADSVAVTEAWEAYDILHVAVDGDVIEEGDVDG